MNGYMDEFNFWGRVLTASEIAGLYNDGRGKHVRQETAMANEIKVVVGCDFNNKTNSLKFGNEVPLSAPPRRSKNNNK